MKTLTKQLMLLVAVSSRTGGAFRNRFACAFVSSPNKGLFESNQATFKYTSHYEHHRLFSTASDEITEKARVLFLGTPDVAATSLEKIVQASKSEGSTFEVVGVVTQPPKRRKRRGKEIPSPVGIAAEELNVPVLCPEKAKDPTFLDELENEIKPDLCITAGKILFFLARNSRIFWNIELLCHNPLYSIWAILTKEIPCNSKIWYC